MDEKYKLKKLVNKLEKIKGRHTELVSVYVPSGQNLDSVKNQIASEAETASNIKSKTVRKNVQTALEKMVAELKKYKKTPENGMVLFSGNVSSEEGKNDFQLWAIHPPEKLNVRLYRCDSEFVLEPLKEMLEAKYAYGLLVLDHRNASVALLKGTNIITLQEMSSYVMGKFKAGGQCLLPETLIQKSNGDIIEISKLNKNEKIFGVDFKKKKVVDLWCLEKWCAKKNEIYSITTKSPRLNIETSREHEFLVLAKDGVKKLTAEELKVGDYLITPEKIDIKGKIQLLKNPYPVYIKINKAGHKFLKNARMNLKLSQSQLAEKMRCNVNQANISAFERNAMNFKWKNLKRLCECLEINFDIFIDKYGKYIKIPKVLNKSISQIVGYLLGDGCCEKYRISFFEEDKFVINKYAEIIESIFEVKTHTKFRRDKNYYEMRVYGSPIVKFIIDNFNIKTCNEKRVPKKILKSDNEIVASFLRGFFDAEGYVSGRVGLGINNKKLAQEIRFLLLRFGIISSIVSYNNRKNPYSNNMRYTNTISDKESLKIFKEKIGFENEKKQNKLIKMIENKSDTSHKRQIFTPGDKIRNIVEKHGFNTRSFPKVSAFFRDERKMSKAIFKNSILKELENNKKAYEELSELLSYEILPVKISNISVSNGRKVDMVDISMQNENFIADGIVVHNSSRRFQREREEQIKRFFKKIGDRSGKCFDEIKNLRGILVGGPGPAKEDFSNGPFLPTKYKNKIITIKDISNTGEHGVKELVVKSEDVLEKEEIIAEKNLVDEFLRNLAKESGLASYGEAEVKKNLKLGAVEKLLLSESLEEEKIEEFSEIAKDFGTEVNIISEETQEGVQLRELGGFAAILRYKIN